MCYLSTPIHSCTHLGRAIISSACPRAAAPTHHCGETVDTGCVNVSTLCRSCLNPSSLTPALGMRGVQGTSMMGMLNAIEAARHRATTSSGATPASSGAGSPVSGSFPSSGFASSVTSSSETAAATGGSVVEEASDVPDLGYLGEMGAVEDVIVPSAMAQRVKMHWRAFAAGLQK